MNGTNYEVPHCGAFSTPPFSSLLGPNIRIKILFSNTISLLSSYNVRDHVEIAHIFKGKSIINNIIIITIIIISKLGLLTESKL